MKLPEHQRHEGRKQTTRAAAFLVVLCAAHVGVCASPPLSLPDVLDAVSAHSEAADQAVFDRQIAAERVNEAKALYLPTVDLSGARVIRDNPIVAEFGQFQAPTGEASYWTYQIGLTQMLWDGGRRAALLSGAQRQRDAELERSAAALVDARVTAATTYLRAVALAGQRLVIRERLRSLDDHLRVVRDMYEQGLVARNDLLETEVRRRVVADQGSALDDSLAVTLADLGRQMGHPPDGSADVPDELPAPPPLPATQEDLRAEALQSDPELGRLEASVAALEASVEARRRAYWPTVAAGLSHVYEQNRYLLYPHANVLRLGLSWQLFDGGTRGAELRQAELELDSARRRLTEAKRRLQVHVEQAFRAYAQARREAMTAKTNIAAAEENLRIEEDQYRAGLARTTDVLDAESTLAESRFQLVNQHVDAYLRQVLLLAAAGRDVAAFYRSATAAPQEP